MEKAPLGATSPDMAWIPWEEKIGGEAAVIFEEHGELVLAGALENGDLAVMYIWLDVCLLK
jgi:hypothetical protein